MSRSDALKILLASDSSSHAVWENFYVIVWKQAITTEAIAVLDKGMADLAATHPNGIGAMLVVEPTAVLPPSEIWQKIAAIMSRHAEVKATATVFEGKGLKQAIYRTVTTTVNLLTTKPTPAEVFATVEAGGEWLVSSTGGTPQGTLVSDLLAAIQRLRASPETTRASA